MLKEKSKIEAIQRFRQTFGRGLVEAFFQNPHEQTHEVLVKN